MNNLSQSEINAKFHQLGVLLLLDAPEHLQFGIDNITWQVGNKFKGLKLIPLGTHIITYSLKNQNYMFPIHHFLYFGPAHAQLKDDQRIKVFKWNSKSERFASLKGEEAEGYRQGVKKYHFDCYLGPYPQQNVQFWGTNTRYITKEVLEKLNPIQYYQNYEEQYQNQNQKKILQQAANIDSDSEGENENTNDLMAKQIQELQIQQNHQEKEKKKQNQKTIKKNKDFGGNIYYSEIPRRLTQQSKHTSLINMDRTEILQAILKSEWPKLEFGILGQVQYSFVAFLIGQCLDSYNQWKKLMILLSSCQRAFQTHKNLMLEYFIVFYDQIRQFPQNFFYDELAKDNFLTICLANFKNYQRQKSINKKCISRISKILAMVKQKFAYQPNVPQEQDPIVVEQHQSYF